MHLQMDISTSAEALLERLLKELHLAHVDDEIELKQLLKKCLATSAQKDVDAYNAKRKAHRAQGAKLTFTNVLRAVLEFGLAHPDLKNTKKLLELLNKVGVARGYGRGTAS